MSTTIHHDEPITVSTGRWQTGQEPQQERTYAIPPPPSKTTQTPPRRTAAKEVTIHEDSYRRTHGRNPKGYGSWAFLPDNAHHDRAEDGTPLTGNAADDERHRQAIWITRSTYANAKRAAAKIAASRGQRTLHTQP